MSTINEEAVDEAQFKKLRKENIKLYEAMASNVLNVGSAKKMEENLNKVIDDKHELHGHLSDVISLQKRIEKESEMEFFTKHFMEQLGLGKKDKDPYGDGDQTKLYGMDAFKLQAQWATGFDYNPETNHKLTDWSKACFYGKIEKVKEYLEKVTNVESREKLLEARESMIRFCGLFHVIAGARINPSQAHIEVAKLLIDAGAKLNTHDVAGYTPLHHCLTKYGNSLTLDIAKILIEKGANVNAVNRFGCTPLFEPCMNCDYAAIEFLISNGCNPNIKENNGLSCHTFATQNPKIHSVFSKSYRTKVKIEKQKAAKENKEFVESEKIYVTKCALCEELGQLKRCSGCLSVAYCSQKCQRNHWKTHKTFCKDKQNKVKAVIVKVTPVANPYGYDTTWQGVLYNEKSKSFKGQKKSPKSNNLPNSEKTMKVKIQVSLGGNGPCEGPMLVYDHGRSFQSYIPQTDANHKRIFDKIIKDGLGGVKAYFGATLKPNGDLMVNIDQMFSERW